MTQYSIAEVRDRFTQLVHKVEAGDTVEVTREGQRVAVLVSAEEYDRWTHQSRIFGRLYWHGGKSTGSMIAKKTKKTVNLKPL